MKDDLQNKIKNFLTEWSSCSNRCTAFPYYWTIADERETFKYCKTGDYIYDSQNGEIRSIKDILEEMNELRDIDLPEDLTFDNLVNSIGKICEEDLVEECLTKYTDDTHLKRYEQDWETYYEGVFFTEQDAKDYLESCSNHHFGPNPRVYLESLNRWGRHSRTEEFLKNLFEYFDVPIPPELYYKNKENKTSTDVITETNKDRFYDKLLRIMEPYMHDFLGYDEENNCFDIVLACKEILEMENNRSKEVK